MTKPLGLWLSEQELQTVRSILERFFADQKAEFYLFGSRVHGPARPDSDLDVLVKAKSEIAPRALAFAREAFEESDLPFRVDLIDDRRIDENFRAKILGNAQKPAYRL